jgi:hypothetical protein
MLTRARPCLKSLSTVAATLGVCACVLALMASPAFAGTAKVENGVLSYTGAPGEENLAQVGPPDEEHPDHFQVLEYGVTETEDSYWTPISAGNLCQDGDEHEVLCPVAGVTKIELSLGDGDDSSGFGDGAPAGVTDVQVFGGPGLDDLSALGIAGAVSVKLYGQDNHDELEGSNLADELYGGGGQDYLRGAGGGDRLFGGGGNDMLGNDRYFWGKGDPGPDVMSGGTGIDRADYSNRKPSSTVVATLEGIANEGTTN